MHCRQKKNSVRKVLLWRLSKGYEQLVSRFYHFLSKLCEFCVKSMGFLAPGKIRANSDAISFWCLESFLNNKSAKCVSLQCLSSPCAEQAGQISDPTESPSENSPPLSTVTAWLLSEKVTPFPHSLQVWKFAKHSLTWLSKNF